MRISLYLDLRNPPRWQRPWAEHYARALTLLSDAEAMGADGVWLTEHHFFEDGYLPQPLTFAAAIAARTERMRIGTAVLLANLRSPVHTAEEAAVVDILSGGRLDLGVGVGYRIPEYEAFDADIGRRYSVLEQRVLDIRRAWTHRVTPTPIQQPIPMWGGFFGQRGAELAGRLGLGLLSLDRSLYPTYARALEATGYEQASARLTGSLRVVVAHDPERTWSIIRPHLEYMWNTYNSYGAEGTGRTPSPIDAEAWRRPSANGAPPLFQVLTPEDTVRFARELTHGLPVRELYVWASLAGMPDSTVQEHLSLLLEQVAPQLRRD